VVVAVAIAVATAARSHAQTLPRLTVQSLEISTDNPRPALEVPFHLIVRTHVRERVSSIDTIVLPILAELELLGDQTTLQQGPNGTEYRETISVVAHHSGRIDIAPVTLQVVDPRDGKPKQYYSNALTIQVGSGPLNPIAPAKNVVALLSYWFSRFALALGGIACVVAVVALIFARRPAPPPQPAPPIAAPAPAMPRSRRDRLSDALIVLRAEHNRNAAIAVRGAIWQMMGASEGETLADVMKRPGAEEPQMNALLHALERAAFTYDEDLPAAIDHACDSLERCLA
jgi:hypothetical protein